MNPTERIAQIRAAVLNPGSPSGAISFDDVAFLLAELQAADFNLSSVMRYCSTHHGGATDRTLAERCEFCPCARREMYWHEPCEHDCINGKAAEATLAAQVVAGGPEQSLNHNLTTASDDEQNNAQGLGWANARSEGQK